MKHYLLLVLTLTMLYSCNNASENEQVENESANEALAIKQVVGIGRIIPEDDIIQLSSPVNGIVQKIYKSENDTLSTGTVILELEHQLEDAKLQQLNDEMVTQNAQIQVDEANLDEAEAKYANAKSEVERLQNLLAKGAETQQAVDDATTNLKSLNADLKRLNASISVSKGKLQETKAAIHTAQIEREQKIIRSPIKGKLLELSALIGGSVTTQQSLGQISPEGKTIAICEIDESNAEKIFVGQSGYIRSVGSSDTLSTGKVYFTSSFLKKKSLFTDQSGEKEDRRVRTIKMTLDDTEELLLNERVECVINITAN